MDKKYNFLKYLFTGDEFHLNAMENRVYIPTETRITKPRKAFMRSSRGVMHKQRENRCDRTFADAQMRKIRPAQGEAINYKGARVMRPSTKLLHKQTRFNHTTKGMVTGETRERLSHGWNKHTSAQINIVDGNFTIKK